MALDTADVRQSRAVKKNLAPASGGIAHRAGPMLEDAVADRHRLPAAVRSATTNTRVVLRVQGVAPHRAAPIARRRCRRWRGQHAAAGVRVAPAERRQPARSSTPSRAAPTSSSPTPPSTRTARVTSVGNVRSALAPARVGLRRPGPPTCAAPSGATTAPRWSSRRASSATGGLDLCLLDVARAGPAGGSPTTTGAWQRRAGPQLRSGVRARRQRRVRVDARRVADAVRSSCPTRTSTASARTSTSATPSR